MKLLINLGSGSSYTKGYINIDLYSPGAGKYGYDDGMKKPDIVGRCELLGYYIKHNTIDEIFSHQVFEHMNRFGRLMCMIGCNNVLKIGGTLRVTVPNAIEIMKKFLSVSEEERKLLYVYLWGWNEFSGGIHCDGFTEEKLVDEMTICGFEIIKANQSTFPKHPYIDAIARKKFQVDEKLVLEKIGKDSVYRDSAKFSLYYNQWKRRYLEELW